MAIPPGSHTGAGSEPARCQPFNQTGGPTLDDHDNLSAHITALRADLEHIALPAYRFLTCSAWDGWKPVSVAEVERQLNFLLDRIAAGSPMVSFGGLYAATDTDDLGYPTVRLWFEAEWRTAYDPFEGTVAVVG